MLRATILSMLLIAISISGCAASKPIVPVPQRCTTPYTPEPVMDNAPCPKDDKAKRYKCVHNKVLKNTEAKNKYAEELKNNSEVCR